MVVTTTGRRRGELPAVSTDVLDTVVDARFETRFGLYAGGGLGVGVQHTMFTEPVYRAQADGYVMAGDRGRTRARGLVDVTVGFDLSLRTRARLRVFAKYRQVILVPFAARNDLPVMGRAQVLLGLAVPLRTRGGAR